MTIIILPAGTFELQYPLGRRLCHRPGYEDLVEMPHASCADIAYAEGDTRMNEIDVDPLLEGRYQLRIVEVPGREYFLTIRLGDNDSNRIDRVTFRNVPIAKGQVHVYDIDLDLNAVKMRVQRQP